MPRSHRPLFNPQAPILFGSAGGDASSGGPDARADGTWQPHMQRAAPPSFGFRKKPAKWYYLNLPFVTHLQQLFLYHPQPL